MNPSNCPCGFCTRMRKIDFAHDVIGWVSNACMTFPVVYVVVGAFIDAPTPRMWLLAVVLGLGQALRIAYLWLLAWMRKAYEEHFESQKSELDSLKKAMALLNAHRGLAEAESRPGARSPSESGHTGSGLSDT